MNAEQNAKKVELSTGIELHYIRQGSGSKVILIHGAMGDYRSWAPQWDCFTEQFDTISYSRRYSYPNHNELTSFDHNALVDAQDLVGLMDKLEIDKAILVGSSYGGFTALAMAVHHPQRVSAIVSVEAPMMRYAYFNKETAPIADEFLQSIALPAKFAFEQGDDEKGVQLLTGGIVGKDASAIPEYIMKRRMLNSRAAKSLALSRDEFPLLDRDALASCSIPMLLMSGKNTASIHKAIFQNVVASIPHAQTKIVDGCGHSVSQQRADIFNVEVMRFINTISESQKQAKIAPDTIPRD